MYRDVHDQLLQIAQRKRAHGRARRQLEAASAQLAAQSDTLEVCERELAKEQRDVAKIEGRTLTALIATIAGSRDQQRAREIEEAKAARVRYEAQSVAVEQLEAQIVELQRELEALGDVEAEYEKAFVSKARTLVDDGGETGQSVARLSEQLIDARSQVKEIDEAAVAGRAALRHLQHARAGIPEEDTSTVIMPVGTAMIPMVFANALSSAVERHLREAQRCVFRFARELEDLEPWTGEQASMQSTTTLLRSYVDDLLEPDARGEALGRTRQAVAGMSARIESYLAWLDEARGSATERWEVVEKAYVERVTHA